MMHQKSEVADKLQLIGFQYIQCGSCCKETSKDSNLVMVYPKEIRDIGAFTGFGWEDIAEPFPEAIEYTDGSRITFEWCIRRREDQCIFIRENSCMIYRTRRRICRMSPFILNGNELIVSDCPGKGKMIERTEAEELAEALFMRAHEEQAESRRVRGVLDLHQEPEGELVVIDGDGVKVRNG